MPFYRFSRWDGTQQVPPIDGEGLMEQLSDHLVAHGDIASALRSLAQRGIRTRSGRRISGIQDMLQRLGDARQGILDRYSLDHVLDDITARLADIVQAERQGIQRRLSEAGDRMDAKSEDPSSGDPSSPTPRAAGEASGPPGGDGPAEPGAPGQPAARARPGNPAAQGLRLHVRRSEGGHSTSFSSRFKSAPWRPTCGTFPSASAPWDRWDQRDQGARRTGRP